MGSRTLPGHCPHGYVIDWGDFGPSCTYTKGANEAPAEYCVDPENCESCYPKCPQCEAARDRQRQQTEHLLHRAAAWRRKFVADHGPDYDNDPTYRLVRDLVDALQVATRTENDEQPR